MLPCPWSNVSSHLGAVETRSTDLGASSQGDGLHNPVGNLLLKQGFALRWISKANKQLITLGKHAAIGHDVTLESSMMNWAQEEKAWRSLTCGSTVLYKINFISTDLMGSNGEPTESLEWDVRPEQWPQSTNPLQEMQDKRVSAWCLSSKSQMTGRNGCQTNLHHGRRDPYPAAPEEPSIVTAHL